MSRSRRPRPRNPPRRQDASGFSGKAADILPSHTGATVAPPTQGSIGASAAWRILAPVLLVVCVVIAYLPAVHAGYIWDDDAYVTTNPLLSAADGLRRIWFSFDSPSQYFPLTYTTFRLEYALWGIHAMGYHCVNIGLHALNALLVWRLLLRLRVPGAWLAATLFGLHPVQVESVAWITELKNVEMGFFFLLSLLAWTEFERRETRAGWFYALSLVLYALALCSKTTACTLPIALLLIVWLRAGGISLRRLLQVLPYVALGGGMGLLTVWWERFHQGTQGALFQMSAASRLLLASHAAWFYLGKLLWPVGLAFSYPRWPVPTLEFSSCGWLAALCAAGGAAFWSRRRLGPGLCVGLVFFLSTLGPVLGFFMLYTFRYTFVADHYQYLACLGPLALAAAGIEWLRGRLPRSLAPALTALVAGVLATLSFLTWRQSAIYRDPETLWRATLVQNPDSQLAHLDLGVTLMGQGRVDEAAVEYNEALRLNPGLAEAHEDMGNVLASEGRTEEAVKEFQKALRLDPTASKAWYDMGNVWYHTGRGDEAVAAYIQALQIDPLFTDAWYNLGVVQYDEGRDADAVASVSRALTLEPGDEVAECKLAWMLAAAPHPAVRDGARAEQLAARVSQARGGRDPLILRTLAAAYAQERRFNDAIQTAEQALHLSEEQGIAPLSGALAREISLYRRGRPYE